MFSPKLLLTLLAGSLFAVSCAPLPPPEPTVVVSPANVPEAGRVNENVTPQQKEEEEARQARIKANQEAKARREALAREQEKNERVEPIEPTRREPVKPASKYRTAMAIPGKPGFVFNPWTNKSVDVRGIPSGTLIRDPNDGNPEHKFRVP